MISLGIDQSLTSTGWCVIDGQLFKFGQITSDKSLPNVKRSCHIADAIKDLAMEYSPDHIVVEGIPFMARSNVTRDLAGLQYLIIDRLMSHGYTLEYNLFIVPPTQLKKFATGGGKASKDDMVDALPLSVKDKVKPIPVNKGRRDIADAYWLAKYGEIQ